MAIFLSRLSLFLALAALIKTVLEYRAPRGFPLAALLKDRFARPLRPARGSVVALVAGSLSVLLPYGLSLLLGWEQVIFTLPRPVLPYLLLAALTLLLKLLWAALEELIYRGALLPQAARFAPLWVAVAVSALLFAFGHLENNQAGELHLLSLIVFFLDGVGFAAAYLATRRLWAPVLWHTAKNAWIWLLYGQSTLQFVPGLGQVLLLGPRAWTGADRQAGLLDLLATALVVLGALIVYSREHRLTSEPLPSP